MVKLKTRYVQLNSDTVESLRKLRPSRQFGEVLVGHVHAPPLLLTLKATRNFIDTESVDKRRVQVPAGV